MINLFEVIPNYTGVAKKEILFVFPFGPAAWLGGIVFINRQNKKAAYKTLATCKKLMIEEKVKIMMYPEGTRNQDGGFLPFKKGAFNMAIETQAPIIPLVISPYYFIDGKKKIFDKGRR
jgi:lysophosphatidate acyltransferase